MKKFVTVLGVEAEGICGIRLEQNGTDWDRADAEFWPFAAGELAHDGEAEALNAPVDGEDPLDGEADVYSGMVAAFSAAAKRFGTHEFVLSVPLSKLLVKISRRPVGDAQSAEEDAAAELGGVSPFPDENPVVGIETVSENDRECTSLIAALPESSAVDIGDALDEAQVRITRTDISMLGWLRSMWSRIYPEGDLSGARKLVILDGLDIGWDVAVLDAGVPSVMRGIGNVSDCDELVREVMLTLIRAGATDAPVETVVFSARAVDSQIAMQLDRFGKVRWETVAGDADDGCRFSGIEGVAMRTIEASQLDITPADWVELRTEARFRKKLNAFLIAAAAGWALAMGTLFGGPMVYGHLTERQKAESRRHAPEYKAVSEMRDKAKLVQQYSDHAFGSLEMLKAVSDRMPEGVTLTSFNYRRGDKLSLSGEAEQPTDVYDFKNALAAAETEADEEGNTEKVFKNINLTGPSLSRGKHKFSIEIDFRSEEGDEG